MCAKLLKQLAARFVLEKEIVNNIGVIAISYLLHSFFSALKMAT